MRQAERPKQKQTAADNIAQRANFLSLGLCLLLIIKLLPIILPAVRREAVIRIISAAVIRIIIVKFIVIIKIVTVIIIIVITVKIV